MNFHSNARLTLRSRADLVEAVIHEGLTLKRAAARFRVSPSWITASTKSARLRSVSRALLWKFM